MIDVVELRQTGFTDTLTDAAISLSLGAGNVYDSLGRGVAALTAASNLYGSAFAVAQVEPMGMLTRNIMPRMLRTIAESLIRGGSCAYMIEVMEGMVEFQPVNSFDVRGGPRESSWRYWVHLPSPSESGRTRNVQSAQLLHFRYSVDTIRPWTGLSPLQRSPVTAGLAVALERSLRDEAGGSHGYLLPVPVDPDSPAATKLKTDLRGLAGKTSLVRTTAGGWDQGAQARPQAEWTPKRLGADPPMSLTSLRNDTFSQVLGACGVPISLFLPGEGGAHRESWRRFLHGSVQPLADTIAEEFSRKLEVEVTLSFDRLFASDISGRARAFQSLVGGGMNVDRAAGLSGLLEGED